MSTNSINTNNCQSAQVTLSTIQAAYLELKQNFHQGLNHAPRSESLNQLRITLNATDALNHQIETLFNQVEYKLGRLLNLRQQYKEQIAILKNIGVLQELDNGTLGIVDILGNKCQYQHIEK